MSRPSRKLLVRKNPQTSRRGFTLVELLVVVLILAILMAVALPLYLATIQNSTRRVARANMKTLANATIAYRMQKGAFPDNFSLGDLLSNNDIQDIPTGPGQQPVYSLFVEPIALPEPNARTLQAGQIAACCSDSITNVNYGCYIPGVDVD